MFKIPLYVNKILDTLNTAGYEAYLVGGPVRDMLLGHTPYDYDITTNATPNTVKALFKKTVDTGIKHGTVTIITDGGNVEVTTYRSEGEYRDFRHPEKIEYVSDLKTDLSRRDFTVNAMAYNEKTGIIDYFGGMDDLREKKLRAVGDAKKRFSEDALRILRLFRFSSTLSFSIEENTESAALALAENLKRISAERIREEIKKAICGKNVTALSPLLHAGGLEFLSLRDGNLNTVNKFDNNALKLFAALINCSFNFENSVKKLKLSAKEETYLLKMRDLTKMPLPKNKAEIKNLLTLYSFVFPDYLTYKDVTGDDISKIKLQYIEIINEKEPYRISDLAISGDDLKKIGLKGEEIGNMLKAAQRLVIEDKSLNYKEILLKKLNID